ncbi:MAG TPA: NAD(P)H-hydrate dehydratase [Acidimicrobiales bacterium]|nr:NAD(P)H-hydrate dehydratase [Acidimicrobiales bacterium]
MALPLLSVDEMRTADARAMANLGVDTLVNAAGTAVAHEAQLLLGGCYGRRVAVVAGPGLNGADGRVAAEWLRRRGARVELFSTSNQPGQLHGYDLYIDAAFGLGCSRPYVAPEVDDTTPILAVDLPSGVDADTGELFGSPARATVTLALGAFKPAHFTGESVGYVGRRRFAGLGIVGESRDALVEDIDLRTFVRFESSDHKWRHAMAILAGSAAMTGAATLACEGALAGGASMVRLTCRGDEGSLLSVPGLAVEIVRDPTSHPDERVKVIVAGPGLGHEAGTWLDERLHGVNVPVVLDADGLDAELIAKHRGSVPWVLTPHEGEFERITGKKLGSNRMLAVRELASRTNCVVLLKGPVTLVANPSGEVRVVTSGTSSLASAGTGDVLSGLIGAAVARGHEPFAAAALSAHLHGRAGAQLARYGRASSLPGVLGELLRTTETSTPGRWGSL